MVEVQVTQTNATLEGAAVQELKTLLRGKAILPMDPEYEQGRKIWNGMIDRHPAIIVQCAGVSDIINSVKFAHKNNLRVAVRGGGHNVAGNAVCNDGVVIDLSRMKSVRVDPIKRTARAEPGLTWGELDRETQVFGLAVTGGIVTTTGIAGFTLGGGLGWLMRRDGLTLDNLISADIVTAKGEFLSASASENADLFWGLRGGGGNFGVVTSFEFSLHPVGPTVMAGMIVYPASQAKEVLSFYREFITQAPNELTSFVVLRHAPPAPFIPKEYHGTPVVVVVGCYAGSIDEGERVLRPLKAFGKPIVDFMKPMPYTMLQGLTDKANLPGSQNYWRSEYLRDLGDAAIETMIAHCAKMTSLQTYVGVGYVKGAVSRVSSEETAYPHRDAPYFLNIVTMWTDPAESENHLRWSREFWSAMRQFSTGGVYVNFIGEEGEDRVRAAYGKNYDRLVQLKNKYDPTNFFSLNQNIKPTRQ